MAAMKLENGKALVLFSGGQDSATCLAWALDRFTQVETIGFDYGQRHRVELEVRPRAARAVAGAVPGWAAKLGEDHVLDVTVLGSISETALTRDVAIEMGENGLPTTFVPGRNLLFFTLAGAYAYRRGIRHIVSGVCETDYSGYPDCRRETVEAMEAALNLGMEADFALDTPLMWIDKAATWKMAEDLGGAALVNVIIEETHTCYEGDRTRRHPWGYGCGACPACDLRAKGYAAYAAGRKAARG